jgi:peptidoglycan/LPS O-acetylase OafA/YrhL
LLFKLGVLLGGYDTRAVNRLLFGNLTLLGAGCLLAVVSYRGKSANCFDWYHGRTKRWFDCAAWTCLGTAVLFWTLFPKEGGLVRYFTNDFLCGTFYMWVILQAAMGVTGRLAALFDNWVLQFVGRISYGLYLVHNWMPDIVEKIFGPMPKYEAAPIVLTLTFAVCILSWNFFEKPILGLKRYFWNAGLRQPIVIGPKNDNAALPSDDNGAGDPARAY